MPLQRGHRHTNLGWRAVALGRHHRHRPGGEGPARQHAHERTAFQGRPDVGVGQASNPRALLAHLLECDLVGRGDVGGKVDLLVPALSVVQVEREAGDCLAGRDRSRRLPIQAQPLVAPQPSGRFWLDRGAPGKPVTRTGSCRGRKACARPRRCPPAHPTRKAMSIRRSTRSIRVSSTISRSRSRGHSASTGARAGATCAPKPTGAAIRSSPVGASRACSSDAVAACPASSSRRQCG